MFALNSRWLLVSLEFVSGTETQLDVVAYDVVIPGLCCGVIPGLLCVVIPGLTGYLVLYVMYR